MSPLREFEKPNPFFQIGLIRGLVLLYRAEQQVLFAAPLGGLPVKEGCAHPAVQLVHVHGIDAVLKLIVFGLKAGYRRIVMSLRVTVALTEGLGHPAHDLIVQDQAL